jgi:hypothetical protein
MCKRLLVGQCLSSLPIPGKESALAVKQTVIPFQRSAMMKSFLTAHCVSEYRDDFIKENKMKISQQSQAGGIQLDDDMVANLEHYLSDSDNTDSKQKPLLDQIMKTLDQLQARLVIEGRKMQPSDEYEQINAARQAVQAATLAMQLYSAGRQNSGQ